MLTAIRPTEARRNMSIVWVCGCDCGTEILVSAAYFKKMMVSNLTVSCGCTPFQHGGYKTGTYSSWRKMLDRVRHKEYVHHYGIVSVCEEWDTYKGGSFENFYKDMGDRPEGYSLNRVEGAPIYSKDTCEWAPKSIQSYDTCRRSDNTSGKTGVRWRKERNCWLAVINVDGRNIRLYSGPSKEDAIAAREKAEMEWYGFLTKTHQTHVKNPA